VVRPVTDILEGSRPEPEAIRTRTAARRVAEAAEDYDSLNPAALAKRIAELEQQMYRHARDLEFEQAAA
ncbi:MAG TPA: hypothetical protein DDZ76_10810, partial [Xanthomonadales bacterium]|nr:hypothetical protein [Xanthomonadales bacterium]